jgi:hypothetical protein
MKTLISREKTLITEVVPRQDETRFRIADPIALLFITLTMGAVILVMTVFVVLLVASVNAFAATALIAVALMAGTVMVLSGVKILERAHGSERRRVEEREQLLDLIRRIRFERQRFAAMSVEVPEALHQALDESKKIAADRGRRLNKTVSQKNATVHALKRERILRKKLEADYAAICGMVMARVAHAAEREVTVLGPDRLNTISDAIRSATTVDTVVAPRVPPPRHSATIRSSPWSIPVPVKDEAPADPIRPENMVADDWIPN